MLLTLPQQDIYYEQLLYPGEPIYNIGAKIAINGTIVYEILNKAYVALIDQHDAYRSILVEEQAGVSIKICAEHDSILNFIDFSPELDPDAAANRYMQATFTKAFDLHAGKLLHKFVLIKVSDTFHYLFSMYHHIITDGWGTSLMFQRWVKNYNELTTDGVLTPGEVYTYSNFVEDDATYRLSKEFDENRLYWKNRFMHLPERIFPKIDQRINVNKSSRKELIVPRIIYDQLELMAGNLKCTTFHVILALLYMYFGRRYQNKDFGIGLPVLNRSKAAFKKTVGLFMGVTALRMQFSFDDTFEELVYSIKQQLRQDYRHQRFPLGKLIQELGAFAEKDRLFNITLSYEKQNYAEQFIDTKTRVIPLTHGAERVALAIYIREFDASEDVKIDFDYHINYFDDGTIAAIVNHFQYLLQQVCSDPKKKLQQYDYFTPEEKNQLLYTFNQTQWEYPRNSTLLTFFNKQVKDSGEQVAVFDDVTTYTYQELETLTDRIAMRLLTFPKIKERVPVAVLMPRSANLVAALLGVLKAGAAYIPLDPDFPQERLKYIVNHSQAACIVGTKEHQDALGANVNFICIDDLIAGWQAVHKDTLPAVKPSDTAYIIYTSGSTGMPKGVAIGHQSLINFLLSMQQKPGLTGKDTFFSVTTQSFDISILEFFAPLISGAKLYVAAKQIQEDPDVMIARLKAIAPSMIQATPGFYQLLYNVGWKGNKTLSVLCGGDLLSASLAEKLLDSCAEVWNMYGPTETTIWSSIKRVLIPEDASCIGSPIHNTTFYILDEYLQPLPIGCPGAIYIGGEGLAKGYYKNETLTAEKFIENPFHPKEKMYETGDMGQWTKEGEIHFLGRNDQQVKIRGYRIELGEIETKLNQLPFVKSSVVIAKKKTEQQAFLIAYVILDQEVSDLTIFTKALQKELPEYMIPYSIIPVAAYPLTPNNKIDRKALASREVELLQSVSVYAEPRTALEVELCGLFEQALERNGKIGVTDNFFSLGGHSLNAMKVVNQIQKQMYYQVSLKDVFNYPTVQLLANQLYEQGPVAPKGIEPTASKPYYPLSPAQYAIWLAAQQNNKRSAAYNVFVVYEITGELDPARLQYAFTYLLNKYEALRTNFIEQEGFVYQKVTPAAEVIFQIDKFTISEDQKHSTTQEYVNKLFNLENDLLLRVGLFKTEQSCLLAFSSHHIILDGWSMGLLIGEITQYYQMPSSQNQLLPFQFRDYVDWLQKTTLERKERNERFWKNYLQDYHWKNSIPAVPGAHGDEYLAGEYNFVWGQELFDSLRTVAHRQSSTVHTFLLTAFLSLLYKVYDESDLCIGTINSGRTIADLHNQVGMFVKTLPLRTKFKPQQPFSAQLKAVHTDLLEIDAYQDFPESSYATLAFDILFVLQPPEFNYDHITVNDNINFRLYPTTSSYTRVPLLVNFIEAKQGLRCVVNYSTGSYDKETIELLFLRYETLLNQLLTHHTDTTLENLDIKLAFEKEQTIEIDFSF
jgi:amino acid adenylation domain-containing protein